MPIDHRDYHPKWKLISHFIRHYRAKNRCEWCGADNHQPHPVTGSEVVLTVAHLDRNSHNNSFFNLAALCQRCHLNYDRPEHTRNRRYGRYHKRRQIIIPFPADRSIYQGRVVGQKWEGAKNEQI